jgi:hypothetical protein
VLSGDVHHTYVSEADYPVPLASRVYQITCSPIQNTIPLAMRVAFHVGWSHTVERVIHLLDRLTRVPPLPIRWHHPTGPHFGNMLASVTFHGREASVRLERGVAESRSTPPSGARDGTDATLEVVVDLALTEVRATP